MNLETVAGRYFEISQKIRALEKEKEELAQIIHENGSFETENFSVKITAVEQERVLSKKELIEVVGAEMVKKLGLLKTIVSNRINVFNKAEGKGKAA